MRGLAAGRASSFGLGLVLVAMLAGVAAASRTQVFHESRPPLSAGAARLVLDFSAYLFFILLLLAFSILAWALWPRDLDGPEPAPRSLRGVLAQLLASALTLALAVLLLTELRLHQLSGRGGIVGGAGGGVNPARQLARAAPATPAAFDWTAAGLVALTLGLAAVVAWRRLDRARREVARRRALTRELRAVVDDTLEDIGLEADPRRAVIQAYVRMERVLEVHGLARRPSDTPFEYLARLLRELSVPPAQAARLTELFEEARFSRHTVSTGMRDESLACLRDVRAALAT